eukprot:TRINITY_DN62184_c0_g1_i1.p1 TRINITY_DN62184_c0_g1~~TRINITY_DN62184_c0_g1_i1.p1  ORF type:complete len:545 (+),score=92.50 TRINITY_DN62184_c0_g1_i1:169-1803(+)
MDLLPPAGPAVGAARHSHAVPSVPKIEEQGGRALPSATQKRWGSSRQRTCGDMHVFGASVAIAAVGELRRRIAAKRKPALTASEERIRHLQVRRCLQEGASTTADTSSLVDVGADESLPADVGQPLAMLLVAQFVLFIGVGAVIPVIPLYGKAIGLTSAVNGLVIAAPAVALLLLAKPAGEYADRARKPAMLFGMAVIVVSDIGTALATEVLPLVVARLGLGAGRCVSESGERGLLADLAGRVPSLRGRALAAQQAVAALGIALGAPLGGLVVEQYSARAAFLCVSAAALFALIIYTALPETVPSAPEGKTIAAQGAARGDAAVSSEQSGTDWGLLLQDNRWIGLSLCESGCRFGFAAKIAVVPIIAASVLPGGATGAGALLSGAGLAGLVGAPLGGFLTDRVGARLTAVGAGLVSGAALCMVPVAFGLLSGDVGSSGFGELSASGAGFALLIVLWGIAVAAEGPALVAIGQQLAPEGAEATALALPRAAGDAVYIVAPFALGLVADASLPLGVDCAVAGAAAIIGAMSLALLSRDPDQPGEGK